VSSVYKNTTRFMLVCRALGGCMETWKECDEYGGGLDCVVVCRVYFVSGG